MVRVANDSSDNRVDDALDKFTTAVSEKYEGALEYFEEAISESIGAVSESAVAGIRKVKSELDFLNSAKDRPWSLVFAAVCGGALIEYGVSSLERVKMGSNAQVNHSIERSSSRFVVPVAIGVIGWAVERLVDRYSRVL